MKWQTIFQNIQIQGIGKLQYLIVRYWKRNKNIFIVVESRKIVWKLKRRRKRERGVSKMENLRVSKRYRLMFNPERTTKQKINITPRRIVKFITVLCWRQFEAISGKALVVLRINEWPCFLRVPSGISRIYTNRSFVRQTRVEN